MAEKNKCTKKRRESRYVEPHKLKPVNRLGGGKPQPRQITSPVKVAAIQNAVLKEARKFVALTTGCEVFPDIEQHLEYLSGTSDTRSSLIDWYDGLDFRLSEDGDAQASLMDTIMLANLATAQKAFYKACMLVPDSEFAYLADNELAVRGRGRPFFGELAKQAAEAAKRQAATRRRHRSAQQPVANGTTSIVASRVAQASSLR